VRYYASTPLHVGSTAIGTLCVWDTDDRPSIRPGLLELLGDLAVIAAGHLELLHTVWVLAGEATTDALTGLPNRRLMMDVLSWALADHRRHGTQVSVVYLDLDGFKAVNDQQGHGVGDEVLREVGRRMRDEVREGETVGRLGGDEFLVVLRRAREDAEQVAVRLGEVLSQPIDLTDGSVRLGASAGVLAVEDPDATVDRVLLRADAAMYDVKRRRKAARAS
jgi:diguanylate cyclase